MLLFKKKKGLVILLCAFLILLVFFKYIYNIFCRCQLKLYHAKRKPFVNMVQKPCCVLWAKAHLKWTVSKWKSFLWSDESKCDILAGNHRRCVLRVKEEGDLSACYQHSIKKSASLIVWGCIRAYGMGSLQLSKDLEQHAPLQMTCISTGQCKTIHCSYYNSMAS